MQFDDRNKSAQSHIQRFTSIPLPLFPSIGLRGPIASVKPQINRPHDSLIEIGRDTFIFQDSKIFIGAIMSIDGRYFGTTRCVVTDPAVICKQNTLGR
jgi:hypothetical protein